MASPRLDLLRYIEARSGGIKRESDDSCEVGGQPDVGRRGELEQALLLALRDFQPPNESVERIARDAALAPRQVFELFIGVWHAIAPQHGLDRFGEDFPRLL